MVPHKHLAHSYLIEYLGGYQDKKNRLLVRINTLSSILVTIERIFIYQTTHIKKEFRKWTLDNVVQMITHYLRKGLDVKKTSIQMIFLGEAL